MAITADVEKASLDQLGNTHIDDVLTLLDHGLERLPSYRELYLRWERQQWQTQELDFTQDKIDNARQLAEGDPVQSEQTKKTYASFWIGEHQVTVDLLPFVIAAPDTEQKLFLTTQVVDEARHMVFFDRFYREVVGVEEETLHERIWAQKPHVYRAYDDIFFGTLAKISEELRQDPGNFELLVRGVTVYHILIEGFLALTGQRFTLDYLKREGLLPGFRAGFTAIMRDESRHITFGTKFLYDAIHDQPKYAAVVQDQLAQTLPLSVSLLEDSDPTVSGYTREEVNEWALRSLDKRLKVIGVASPLG
ncbi:MAG: ribonucleoside-diphosphate reductase beta chain [Chloroflexota bacterium]|jgi:ribonucleoside-diphosphate reductase beta chain|nr:ribonucleoside-diphosphate reductase beta chain [Chloroflexota bacterium]